MTAAREGPGWVFSNQAFVCHGRVHPPVRPVFYSGKGNHRRVWQNLWTPWDFQGGHKVRPDGIVSRQGKDEEIGQV